MSSNSTRARKERNVQDRVSESLTEVDKAFIAELKRFSDVSNSTAGEAGGSTNNSPTSPAGNYLARKGDSMLGPIALSPPLDFTIDIDANNTINISPLNDNNQYSSNIQLEDVPTSTTLDIIAGATFDGQILILRTFAPNPITISQATLSNGGNIQTPDSTDVILGDLQMVILVFDEALTIEENTGGTWRLLNTFGTGGVVTDASVATLSLPSVQSAGVVDFDSIRLGTGINPETEDGVFRLSGGIFQLNSSVLIVGTNDTMDAQWQFDTEAAFNNPVLIGRASRSITLDSSPSNLSTAPITTAFVDATTTDVFVRLFTINIFGGTGTIQTVGTWGQIFSIGGGEGGGGDVTLPIRFPVTIGLPTTGNVILDLNQESGHYFTIGPLTGNIDISIINPPAANTAQAFRINIIKGATDFTVTFNDTLLVQPFIGEENTTTLLAGDIYDGAIFNIFTMTSTAGSGGAQNQTPWEQQIEGVGFTLNEAGKIVIKPTQTDGLQGILELIRNDTTPEDGNIVGQILFKGPDDIGGIPTWAIIEADSDDVTNDAKQGQFKISVQHDNSLAPIIDYTGNDGTFRFSSGVDIVRPNTNGFKELGTSSFFWDDVFSETFTLRGSGGNTTGTDRTIYAEDGGGGMVFNMPTTGAVFTHSVENKIFSLLTNGELEVRTELDDGPTLRLRNNDQTPIGGSNGPKLFFTANDDALTQFTYGSIKVDTTSVVEGAKNATMSFNNMATNSLDPFMNFIGALEKINMFKFLDMNNNYIEFDDRSDPGATIATERILFSDSANSAHLSIRTNTGIIDLESGAGAGANQTLSNLTNPTAVSEDLNLDLKKITFSSATSMIQADSTNMTFTVPIADGFKFVIGTNDTLEILANGDLQINGKDIFGIVDLSFQESGIDIKSSSSGLEYVVASGDSHVWEIGTTQVFNISSSQIIIGTNVNTFNFQTADLTNVDDILFAEGHNIFSTSVGLEFNVAASDDRIDFEVASGNLVLRILNDQIDVSQDIDMASGKTVDFSGSASSATGGSAGPPPTNVQGFITIKVDGVSRKVAFYQT